MLAMEPVRQQVGGWPDTPATRFLCTESREQRCTAVVPGLFWPRYVHFHWFVHVCWRFHFHGFLSVGQKAQPVPAWDCPTRMPSMRKVSRLGCRTTGSSSSMPTCTARLISVRGSDVAILFVAVAGSRTVVWMVDVPVLPAAVCLVLLPSPRAAVVPLVVRRRPAVAVLSVRRTVQGAEWLMTESIVSWHRTHSVPSIWEVLRSGC